MNLLKRYYVIVLTTVVFLCCSTTCENEPTEWMYFSVENKDTDTIYVAHTWKYDESDFTVNEVFSYEKYYEAIAPGEIRNDFYLGIPEGELNKQFKYKNDDDNYTCRHHIFVFRRETLNNYSPKELIEKNIYDAKYVLTSKEILNMDYIVPYPMGKADDTIK